MTTTHAPPLPGTPAGTPSGSLTTLTTPPPGPYHPNGVRQPPRLPAPPPAVPRPVPEGDPGDSPDEGGHAVVRRFGPLLPPAAYVAVVALGITGGVVHGWLTTPLTALAVTGVVVLAGGTALVAGLLLTSGFARLAGGGAPALLTAGWLAGLWQGPSLWDHLLVGVAATLVMGWLAMARVPAGTPTTLPTTPRAGAARHRAPRGGVL